MSQQTNPWLALSRKLDERIEEARERSEQIDPVAVTAREIIRVRLERHEHPDAGFIDDERALSLAQEIRLERKRGAVLPNSDEIDLGEPIESTYLEAVGDPTPGRGSGDRMVAAVLDLHGVARVDLIEDLVDFGKVTLVVVHDLTPIGFELVSEIVEQYRPAGVEVEVKFERVNPPPSTYVSDGWMVGPNGPTEPDEDEPKRKDKTDAPDKTPARKDRQGVSLTERAIEAAKARHKVAIVCPDVETRLRVIAAFSEAEESARYGHWMTKTASRDCLRGHDLDLVLVDSRCVDTADPRQFYGAPLYAEMFLV